MMRLGIVGNGVVGQALRELLYAGGKGHEVWIYDKFQSEYNDELRRQEINKCELVFVAVPTPEKPDGGCDVSAVEEAVDWVEPPACIKSTVPPGTTQALAIEHKRLLCFSPEYVGETPWHGRGSARSDGFVIVGGERATRELVVRAYQEVLGPTTRYYLTDATAAELCKYMVNAFLATKVAFVNQFYDLAEAFGVNYNELRELWLADERIGRSHTAVTQERGYGGRCLPKDMAAIIHDARRFADGAALLEAVDRFNDEVVRRARAERREVERCEP